MNFNPFNLIGKVSMNVHIKGELSSRAAAVTAWILAVGFAAALLVLAAGAAVWLIRH